MSSRVAVVAVALALFAAACAPSPSPQDASAAPLRERIGQVVELRGEYGGLAKAGHFVEVDDEPIYIEGESHDHAPFNAGEAVTLRGTLRHTGPLPLPPGCKQGEPCAVAVLGEHYFMTDAVVEPAAH